MKRRNGWSEWAAFVACLLLSALLLFLKAPGSEKVWTDRSLSWEGKNHAFSLEEGYGIKSAGPYVNLAAGRYRIKWRIRGDGENAVVFSSSNDARIVPERIVIPADNPEGEAEISLLDPVRSFSLGVEFASGSEMTCEELRLYSPRFADGALTVSALLFALFWLWLACRRGWLSGERGAVLFALLMAAVLACSPSMQPDTTGGWDVQFHAARIANLADALAAGHFPPRVGGFSYNGYGAVTSVFYPDLFLLPAALALFFGASMSFAVNGTVILLSFFTAASMYVSVRRMQGTRETAAAAAVFYTLSGYRLWEAYGFSMLLGEMIGMAVLPLWFAALYHVLWGDQRQWSSLAFAFFLLWNAHVLTAALAVLAAICAAVFEGGELIRNRERRRAVFFSGLFALLTGLFRLLPMLDLYGSGVNTGVVSFGFAESALIPRELFAPDGRMGIGLWLGAAAGCFAFARAERKMRRLIGFCLGSGLICAFLSTRLFPWSQTVRLTGGLCEILQFPWRFLILTSFCFSLAAGCGAGAIFSDGKGKAAAVALLAAALAAAPALRDATGGERGVPFGESASPYMVYPEYQIEGTDVNATRSRMPNVSGGAELIAYEKKGTRIDACVRAENEGEIAFPLFAFKGYESRLNGQPVSWHAGENNRLTVDIPAGTEAPLTVRWKTPLLWRLADVISLLSLLMLFALCRREEREAASAEMAGRMA